MIKSKGFKMVNKTESKKPSPPQHIWPLLDFKKRGNRKKFPDTNSLCCFFSLFSHLTTCFILSLFFRFRLQHQNSEHPEPWSDPAIQVLLSLLTCPLQQRQWDQLLVILVCPRGDSCRGPPSAWHTHSLPPVKNPPPRPNWPPPRPHAFADLFPSPHKSVVPLRTCMQALVQPGVGPEAVEHHPANWRAAPCRPCHQGPDPSVVPGYPECVSDPRDGGGEWLQEAHWPRAACGRSVLPRATSPGGCWLL